MLRFDWEWYSCCNTHILYHSNPFLKFQHVGVSNGFAKQFIPDSKDILAYTDMIDGGVEVELEFTAPEKPGDYEYVCTFPGHAFVMRGVLTVKAK